MFSSFEVLGVLGVFGVLGVLGVFGVFGVLGVLGVLGVFGVFGVLEVFVSKTPVCAYPFNTVHKSEKQSKLSLPGSHYLSSFIYSKLIWIVFLFENFRELPTVASFENYPIRSAQVQSPLAEVRAPK